MVCQEDIVIQVETFKVPLYLSLSCGPDFPFSDIGPRGHELETVGSRWGIHSHYPSVGVGWRVDLCAGLALPVYSPPLLLGCSPAGQLTLWWGFFFFLKLTDGISIKCMHSFVSDWPSFSLLHINMKMHLIPSPQSLMLLTSVWLVMHTRIQSCRNSICKFMTWLL